MAVLKNRAGVTTSTTGTGTITLGSGLTAAQNINAASWLTFAQAGALNGDQVRYLILDSNGAWEYGPGIYTTAGTTLARAVGAMDGTIAGQRSSTAALLSLSGTAQVFITAVAEDLAVASVVASPQGRLTLTSGTPVMTATAAAKTAIFYTPYAGNQIPLYNGTAMVPTTFPELSNVTTASSVGSAGPAAVAANSNYDLFVWSNAGSPTLTRGPVWSSTTGRSAGTAIVMVNGILLNAVAITNGPAIQRGTYVGTVRSNASSQIDWVLPVSPYGVQGRLCVWNCYNRRLAVADVRDGANSWTVTNSIPAFWNVNANNSCLLVRGLEEDAVTVTSSIYAAPVTSGVYLQQLDIDGTVLPFFTNCGPGYLGQVEFTYTGMPGLGAHTLAVKESSVGSFSITLYGGTAGVEGQQLYHVWC